MHEKQLMILINNHPNLPVIPMVTSDIVVPFNGYWPCKLGPSYIGEYIRYHGEIYVKENGGIPIELMDAFLSWEPYMSMRDIESKIENMWIKGILLHIDEEKE